MRRLPNESRSPFPQKADPSLRPAPAKLRRKEKARDSVRDDTRYSPSVNPNRPRLIQLETDATRICLFFGAGGAGFWFGRIEAVADPGFGVDVARMAGVGLDF